MGSWCLLSFATSPSFVKNGGLREYNIPPDIFVQFVQNAVSLHCSIAWKKEHGSDSPSSAMVNKYEKKDSFACKRSTFESKNGLIYFVVRYY